MPGLLGYIYDSTDVLEIGLITKMCQSLLHEDWYKTDLLEGGTFAFARVHQNIFNPEPQPIYNKDRSLCIFMYGKIYGYEDDLRRLEKSGHVFKYRNDPEYSLYLFEEKGVDFVKELNGSFVIVTYNLKEDEICIFNDRYGLRPLYYSVDENRLIFACEVKAVLKDSNIKRTINKAALADFFHVGQLMGNNTFIEDIKVLPPASMMIYKNNQLQIYKYWNFKFLQDDGISKEEYADLLVRTWTNAIRIRMAYNVKYGLALSGGMDSRAILAAIPKESRPSFSTFTFGNSDCGEVKVAKRVADRVDVKHLIIEPDLDHAIRDYAERVVNINDGMNQIVTSIILSSYEKVRDKIEVCFDGVAGGTILGGGFLQRDLLTINTDDALISYVKNQDKRKEIFSKNDMLKLFSSLGMEVAGLIDRYIDDLLDVNIETTPVNKFDSLISYYSRLRRSTMLGDDQMRSKFEQATPFFDNEFIDVLLKIPPELRLNHRIFREFFIKLSPELSMIKYLTTGIPVKMPILIWELGRNYKRVIRKLKKIVTDFSKGKIRFDEKDSATDLKEWIRTEKSWRDFVEERLKELPENLFNKEYVSSLFQDHLQCKRDNSAKISRLVSFSIFYNGFIKE